MITAEAVSPVAIKVIRFTKLHYKGQGSDKIYNVYLCNSNADIPDRYDVRVEYGKRLATPTPLIKGSDLGILVATKMYEKIVRQQTHRPDGQSYSIIETELEPAVGEKVKVVAPVEVSDEYKGPKLLPQLLNIIPKDQFETYLKDDDFWMQEKYDGKRIILSLNTKKIVGLNRRGLPCAIHADIEASAKEIIEKVGKIILDGEMVNNTYHAFDCLRYGKDDLRDETYSKRYHVLRTTLAKCPILQIVVAPIFQDYDSKAKNFEAIKASKSEGVVFKRHSSKYVPGRPNSLGDHLKFKLIETASVVVVRVNEQRSVGIAVMDGFKPVRIGNVTVPPDKQVPNVGDVLEVQYLYAYEGGSLYQPVFLNLRDDLTSQDCQKTKLKFKPTSESDESDA